VTKQRAREVLAERREINAAKVARGGHVHMWTAINAATNRYACDCGKRAFRVGGSMFRVLREGTR
jgi:hypothetical protein